jgi:hypothetical protein
MGEGLITRRSRVQIPPPLRKALVSDLLTRASIVPGHFLWTLAGFSHRLYQGFWPTYDLRVSRGGGSNVAVASVCMAGYGTHPIMIRYA